MRDLTTLGGAILYMEDIRLQVEVFKAEGSPGQMDRRLMQKSWQYRKAGRGQRATAQVWRLLTHENLDVLLRFRRGLHRQGQ